MNLLINYYIDQNPARQKELDFCLQKNLENPLIEKIYLFNENIEIPKHEKIESIKCEHRPTYTEFFLFGSKIKGIKILANSDIYFDTSLNFANNIQIDEIFALCRWNYTENGLKFYNKKDSQDVWIWRDRIFILADFNLGIPGCDNSLLYKLDYLGYEIKSPAKSIQCIHVHNSEIRNYESSKGINKFKINQPYLFIDKFY